MNDFKEHIARKRYLVVLHNKDENKPFLCSSLREIGENILIDYSTISKKLKENDHCFCTCKDTNSIYYIKKL